MSQYLLKPFIFAIIIASAPALSGGGKDQPKKGAPSGARAALSAVWSWGLYLAGLAPDEADVEQQNEEEAAEESRKREREEARAERRRGPRANVDERRVRARVVVEEEPALEEATTAEELHVAADAFLRQPVALTNLLLTNEATVVGNDRDWLMNNWIPTRAPYLAGDLRHEDGARIAIEQGDILVLMALNGQNPRVYGREYYLPLTLLRQMQEGAPLLRLMYRGQPRTLFIAEGLRPQFQATLDNIERFNRHTMRGAPMQPLQHPVTGALRWQLQEAMDLTPQGADADLCQFECETGGAPELCLCEHPIGLQALFQETEGAALAHYGRAGEHGDERFVFRIAGPGRAIVTLWNDYILVLFRRTMPQEIRITEEMYFNAVERVAGVVVDLRRLGITAAAVLANMNRARLLRNGILYMPFSRE